jgi:hypothetical protein
MHIYISKEKNRHGFLYIYSCRAKLMKRNRKETGENTERRLKHAALSFHASHVFLHEHTGDGIWKAECMLHLELTKDLR